MSTKKLNGISVKSAILPITIAVILLFSAIFVWNGIHNSSQAGAPRIANVSFKGEYKIGEGEWQTYEEGVHIPADKGDVTLCGIFVMHNPETNEPIGTLSKGSTVNVYLDHISGYVILSGGGKIFFDAENDSLGEDACAIMWGAVPSMAEEPITIVLHNPHSYGNTNAIDHFFEYMSIAPGVYFESIMLTMGEAERTVGSLIIIISIVIIGISTFSSIIHIKYSKQMWLIGLMSFFAGGYFMFDAFAVSLWNEPYIFNTRALGLCMMLYMIFSSTLIVMQLTDKMKACGTIAIAISTISTLVFIATSISANIKFYDTWVWWAIIESVVVIILIVCQILNFPKSNNTNKFFYIMGISTFVAFIFDFVAIGLGWWEGGFLSKIVFLIVFAISLIIVLRIIPSHINAAVKARALEAEKQALNLELQESRISIMLSQMRPHFIFNTLNTIYHLCEINPDVARSTIESFSKYLRNNINNLDRSEMIHFDKEMSFVKAYLDIEKVRFDDELQITFDTKVTNFKLPVLTVQPIVENAVKHGTSKKEGVSSLFISTRETDAYYEIEIRDTGIGFDTNYHPSDEYKHIGITNVRQRLENLCNGTLTIESTIGIGTTATIKIPKKKEESIL